VAALMQSAARAALAARACAALLCLLAAWPAHSAVRLAGVFGDHMVLQRHQPITVWGWADAGEAVQVRLNGARRSTRAGADGRWAVQLPAMGAGGPYTLQAQGRNLVALQDVWVGELWLAAGQSNMEWTLAQSADAQRHIAQAGLPLVRHVKLPHRASLQPQADVAPLTWQVSTPANAGGFSAVGYHFARALSQALRVPVGVLNASWGGSNIETWTSPTAARQDPVLAPVLQAMPADEGSFSAWHAARQAAIVQAWHAGLPLWTEATPPPWHSPAVADADWPTLAVPQVWEAQGLAGFDGHLWLRRRTTLSAEQAAGPATLHLGAVDDCDQTWVNGQPVGGQCGWDTPRAYPLPPGLLQAGPNLVAVRVRDTGGDGGLHGPAAGVRLDTAAGSLPLAGRWQARAESPWPRQAPGMNDLPTLAFNGMLLPLLPLRPRGVLWYQGESNVPRAARYARQLQDLVQDWRRQMAATGPMPFYVVQLAPFQPRGRNDPQASDWAELRDAQRQVLALPGTGLVVTTDVGDPGDIHPTHKAPVGQRLAALALRRVHGLPVVDSGPVVQRVQSEADGRMRLFFQPPGAAAAAAGEALADDGQRVAGFAVAGADRQFYPAHAQVQGQQVLVWHPQVPQPVAVRYGWVDSPHQAGLRNRAGWPASPFRTDDWPLSTQAAPPASGQVLQGSVPSALLQRDMAYTAYLPAGHSAQSAPLPVLYLLHGAGDDAGTWLRAGRLDRLMDALVAAQGLQRRWAVVMPSLGPRSWWVDAADGPTATALVQEFLPALEARHNLGGGRPHRAVAGHSMGGYGALQQALRQPGLYCAAGLISPATYDPLPPANSSALGAAPFQSAGGFDAALWTRLNHPALLPAYARAAQPVPMWLGSGAQDELGIARSVARLAQQLAPLQPGQVQLQLWPGKHDWDSFATAWPQAMRFIDQRCPG